MPACGRLGYRVREAGRAPSICWTATSRISGAVSLQNLTRHSGVLDERRTCFDIVGVLSVRQFTWSGCSGARLM